LSERVRQVVILSIGSVWKASYELYAHAAAARTAGLSEDTIGALAVGEPATELNEQEQVAQQFSLHLVRERRIDDELYRIALRFFGEKGLVDMIMLAGCYLVVCSLLNAFAVPAPETDHDP
jgi:4-carboxymuconolactone decarboxylase